MKAVKRNCIADLTLKKFLEDFKTMKNILEDSKRHGETYNFQMGFA